MSEVEVRRSTRRRRTVSAYRDGDRIVVLIPAGHSARQEREWIHQMVSRLEARDGRDSLGDERLAARAADLSAAYLGGLAKPASIVWVSNQRRRWGSCTPVDATIRISDRVARLPGWVQDYVILHELAHLLQPGHGPEFWTLLRSYPKLERAKGYLEGYAHAAQDGPSVPGESGDCVDG
ncbi:M48 metallopeptidase family protein [Arsenicicoccus sp. oral taxon 190]|uniref:M48 metallopeptidase family protein n=1 Tax=Arsenicicoccus sp. oral taxon 190 TaxID=1658671 RepID=UPI00067A190C|nr:M48 family metallopeptidase [Arsenicicoccus sp. oral taxon 190]AKT51404.1 metal-dependent hydrolase [Arsenicicoccus sp. oral taxon 190]